MVTGGERRMLRRMGGREELAMAVAAQHKLRTHQFLMLTQ